MPAQVTRTDLSAAADMTDAQIRAALTDTQAVALTLWGEARSEPLAGVIAVADVIRNRRRGTKRTWKAVVHQRLQFSCWSPAGGRENYDHVMLLARVLVDDGRITGDWGQCLWVAEGAVDGRYNLTLPIDTTHYLTTALFRKNPPAWAHTGRVVATLGQHTFIAGVR